MATLVAVCLSLTGLAVAPSGHAGVTVTPIQWDGAGPIVGNLAVGGPGETLYASHGENVVQINDTGQIVRVAHALGQYSQYGLAADGPGNLYVSYWNQALGKPSLRKVSTTGTIDWDIAFADSVRPEGLSFHDGIVWGASQMSGRVLGFSAATGAVLHDFAAAGATDTAALPNGNVLVRQWTQDGVTEYTPAGVAVRTFSQAKSWIALGPGGSVVGATDANSSTANKIIRWDAQGTAAVGYAGNFQLRDIAAATSGETWAVVYRPGTLSGSYASPAFLHLDPATPDVSLTASAQLADTGQAIVLDASGSTIPFHQPTRFEWDLDGNGTFETDSGTTGTITHSYPTRGVRTVTVRVTAPSGLSKTTGLSLDIRAASPVGPAGASINAGAQYTNDPNVTVSLRWPKFAQEVVISNDGGFFPMLTLPVDPTISWTLDSSGDERLPKTIYVRFTGGQAGAETYQDDIILDQTKPTVVSASAKTGGGNALSTGLSLRGGSKKYKITLKAKDANSGVAQMQITHRKAKPGAWKPYKPKTTYKSPSKKLFARVIDRAGNISTWKRLK